MKKWILLALFINGSFGLGAQTIKKPDYREALILIDKWLDGQRDFDHLPGIAVSIVKDQQIIWSKGYGYANLDKRIPMDPQTICSICSISKLFTSIAVMQLVEEGKLRLDDSINAVLPAYSLQQQYAESGPITIRSLLTHSSGLPREAAYPYWTGPDFPFPSTKEVVSKLGTQKTLYPASTYFQYSNLGMTLLGEVVEHISGQPYEQYIETHVLNPLGLNSTHPSLPQTSWGKSMAIGYSAVHRDGHRDPMPFFQAKGIAPAAGFSSNAEDLARFAIWQFRLLDKGGKEVLKSSTLRDMQRVQFLDPDWKIAYGLGFNVRNFNGTNLVGHGGSCPGYLSSLNLDPKEKLAVIVMINGQGENPGKYSDGIIKILKMAAQFPPLGPTDTTILSPFVGNYDDYNWGSEEVVFRWKGNLGIMPLRTNDPVTDMIMCRHVAGDVFRRIRSDDTLGEEISFERDGNGKVTKLWRSNNFVNKITP
jgi:CubicO group peptidase (beta-lactamase class C family)